MHGFASPLIEMDFFSRGDCNIRPVNSTSLSKFLDTCAAKECGHSRIVGAFEIVCVDVVDDIVFHLPYFSEVHSDCHRKLKISSHTMSAYLAENVQTFASSFNSSIYFETFLNSSTINFVLFISFCFPVHQRCNWPLKLHDVLLKTFNNSRILKPFSVVVLHRHVHRISEIVDYIVVAASEYCRA